MIPFAVRCGFRQFVPFKVNPLRLKNLFPAASNIVLLDFCLYVRKGKASENDLKELESGSAAIRTWVSRSNVVTDYSNV
jgi:hypothetical protein